MRPARSDSVTTKPPLIPVDLALAHYDPGLNVVPPWEDGSKARALITWTDWQSERRPRETVASEYRHGRTGTGALGVWADPKAMPDWWEQLFPSWEKAQLAWNAECDAFNEAQAIELLHNDPDPFTESRWDSWEEAVTAEAQFNAVLGFEAEEAVDRAVQWAYNNGYHDPRSPLGRARVERRPYPRVESQIDRVKASVSMEQVADQLTAMRWSGGRGRGPCPLHGGHNPSAFTVYCDTQSFFCFNCRKGGDVVELARVAMDRGLL